VFAVSFAPCVRVRKGHLARRFDREQLIHDGGRRSTIIVPSRSQHACRNNSNPNQVHETCFHFHALVLRMSGLQSSRTAMQNDNRRRFERRAFEQKTPHASKHSSPSGVMSSTIANRGQLEHVRVAFISGEHDEFCSLPIHFLRFVVFRLLGHAPYSDHAVRRAANRCRVDRCRTLRRRAPYARTRFTQR